MIGVFSISPLKNNCLLEKTFTHKEIHLEIKYNNTQVGLSEYYNNIIETHYHKFDTLIFCHHDVSLRYTNIQAVLDGLKQYDVVGVAGGINPKIVEKNLWHWMMPKDSYRGIAGHSMDDQSMYVTSFGPTPSRVAILDGVFLALDSKKIYNSKARFDNNFKWHHYDIDFSLTCNYNKLKLGVWPILIQHDSPGLWNIDDIEWNRSNQYFIKKWSQ